MHTVFALLCFVVVMHELIFSYPPGLIYWHCGNLTIAPVPAKQPWWIWINTSSEFIMNDCITTTKQSTTKPCAYFLGYTVPGNPGGLGWHATGMNYSSQPIHATEMQSRTWGTLLTLLHLTVCCTEKNAIIHFLSSKWWFTADHCFNPYHTIPLGSFQTHQIARWNWCAFPFCLVSICT